ncbi:MAG: type VI secretion system baseplate subunit TssG [Paracoccus sp. (in: a-proteobacteria)]|uniref:type VI secretion system baseplate subunit TssG n=1 Tax=Paracoccus sp. TaxID=267 RepID=UPI0026DF75D2|nr:type VI secretion system baseplate subunit TssG [Paracoccus sp. (in: a-proteobacteria)]MDO5622772.1 type VI secretion system baseplate subunit TssG [Paracoccus sp. (in: a-proteobacteria)]
MAKPLVSVSDSASRAGFLALLRRLEREAPDKPRIGRSRHRGEDIVQIGQDPYLDFPASEFSSIKDGGGSLRLRARFMGFFGPQGALPLNTTEEVLRWADQGEDGFVRFTDILSGRFYQLFFRAWSDSHAISQHDRPEEDRFATYIAAISGTGTPAYHQHDEFPDIERLPLVSVFGGRVRSPVRLAQMLRQHFRLAVEVEEFVPNWLTFEPDDRAILGMVGGLGQDLYLGARVQSVNEKIRICLNIPTLDAYRAFLPGQREYRRIAALVFWYLGQSYLVDLALSLPADQIAPAALGGDAALGWMAALKPVLGATAQDYVEVASFALDAANY